MDRDLNVLSTVTLFLMFRPPGEALMEYLARFIQKSHFCLLLLNDRVVLTVNSRLITNINTTGYERS